MRCLFVLLALLFLPWQSLASMELDVATLGVAWCVEDGLEADPNEVVTACAIIRNSGDCPQLLRVGFRAPVGWEVRSLDPEEFLLPPGYQELYSATVRAPKNCSPGRYAVEIFLSLDGEIVSWDTLWVPVGSYAEVLAQVQPYPSLVAAGVPYELTIDFTNKGNVDLPLDVVVHTSPDCFLEVQDHAPENSVGGFSVFVTPDPDRCDAFKQLVNVKLINTETCEIYWEHTAVTEVLPQAPYAAPPTLSVPGWIGLYGGQEHGKSIVGVEMYGGGIIDENTCRWIDYEVRLPTENYSGVYNQIQIVRGAIGESDVWAIEGGDSVFGLTPLTERWRFGRGVQGFGTYGEFETAGMYVSRLQGTDDQPQEFGGYLMWRPDYRTFFSWNYLHKSPIGIYPEADIQSLRLLCGPIDCFNAEVEVAKDFGPYNNGKGKNAYRVGLFGMFPRDQGSMSFERIKAGPGFLGYYHNVDMTTGNFDAALTNCLRAGGCATWYKQDIGEESNYLSVLPDNRFFTGQLTYLPTDWLQYTLAGRVLFLRDRSEYQSFNVEQKWADLRVCYSNPGFVATGSMSLGEQYDRLTNQKSWPLQVYSLYGCWQGSPNFEWNLLSETGNIQYYDVTKWRTAVGGGFCWRLSPQTCFNCCGNIAVNMPELCLFKHISATLSHTLSNRHRVYVNAQYFSCKLAADPKDFRWFVSYDIPFDVVIPQEIQTGYVCGIVLDRDTQQPIENAVVSLSGQRTMTDAEGAFRFPTVDPGCYEVYADLLPQNYTAVGAQKSLVTVRKGNGNHVRIETVQVCRLQGRIVQYDLGDTLEAAEKFFLYNNQPDEEISNYYVEVGGVAEVRVTLCHADSDVSYTYRTTPFGHFRFDKLRPGTWILYVEPADIDTQHVLPVNSWEFTLEPGDDEFIEIKATPKRGQILSTRLSTKSRSIPAIESSS